MCPEESDSENTFFVELVVLLRKRRPPAVATPGDEEDLIEGRPRPASFVPQCKDKHKFCRVTNVLNILLSLFTYTGTLFHGER